MRSPVRSTVRDPAGAATVIRADRFAGEARTAAELVATAPGVAVHDYGGLGQWTSVSIRGSSAEQVKVLLDGLPLDTTAGGGVDLSSVPGPWISRIEVIRGAEGAHYGAGALGGVVDIVTPQAGERGASAEIGAGSFGTLQLSARAETPLSFAASSTGAPGANGGLLASLTAARTAGTFDFLDPQGAPQTRRNADSALAGALLKGWLQLGGSRFDALAQLSGGHRGLPGTASQPTPDDWQDEARLLAAVRFRRPLGESLSLASRLHLRGDRLDSRISEPGVGLSRQRDLEAGGEIAVAWAAGPSLLTGTLSAAGQELSGTGSGDHARATLAAALAEQLWLFDDRLLLVPALRLEQTGADAGLSASLGSTFQLAGPLALRSNVGTSYRAPSFAELYLQQGVLAPNPDLRPETGFGGDAALVASGPLGLATLGGFATLYRDLIQYGPASFRRLMPQNDAKALLAGLEAEVIGAPFQGLASLSPSLAYTYQWSENLRGTADALGRELTRRPRHRLYLRLAAALGPLRAHADLSWVSRQFLDPANRAPIPAVLALGAGASVRLWRAPFVRLSVEARNLLDDRSLQDSYGYPLPGRTLLATLHAGGPEPEENP